MELISKCWEDTPLFFTAFVHSFPISRQKNSMVLHITWWCLRKPITLCPSTSISSLSSITSCHKLADMLKIYFVSSGPSFPEKSLSWQPQALAASQTQCSNWLGVSSPCNGALCCACLSPPWSNLCLVRPGRQWQIYFRFILSYFLWKPCNSEWMT